MTNGPSENSVLGTILDWSEARPNWQKDALRRIVVDGLPDDDGLDEVVALARKEHGDDSVTAKAEPLKKENLPTDPGAGESVRLESMSDIAGVNQLAPDQIMTFETGGLTVIYGKNGTGKSGYARVLKKSCRARFPGEIMPDMLSGKPPVPSTAKLTIKRADGTTSDLTWTDSDKPDPLLSAITVFDKDCGNEHIRRENEVWFRPFGLDIPDDLATLCINVRTKLTNEKTRLEDVRDPVFDDPSWSAVSEIGKVLNALSHDTDLSDVNFDTPLTDEEEKRLAKLIGDLAQDPAAIATTQKRDAGTVRQLIRSMTAIEKVMSKDGVDALDVKQSDAIAKRKAADLAADEAFGDLELDGVGQPVWKELWDSARKYSDSLEKRTQNFPPTEGELCVLCHQEIDDPTAKRLTKFEDFIKQESEDKAVAAERAFKEAREAMESLKIEINQVAAARTTLSDRNPDLAKKILKFMAAARLRRIQWLRNFENESDGPLVDLPAIPSAEIIQEADDIKTYAASLKADSTSDEREALLAEHGNLQDRKNGEKLKTIAEAEIKRLKQLNIVEACHKETNTRTITNLGNKIADELVTPKMQDRFQDEIVKLAGRRVRVKFERSGGHTGSPHYAIKFFANEDAKVHQVLSEGEQTCVALAAYLTELATATHTSALVFDDPVSSLDHRWRRKVAERLAEEAQTRQVIVFTHDLVFLNDIDARASDLKVPIKFATLDRAAGRVGVLSEGLPWRAGKLPQRVDTLQKEAREAKKLYEAGDETAYEQEARKIYSKLRATWERGIEMVVFANVIQRQREYVDVKNLRAVVTLDDDDVDAFEVGHKKCCDFTEAHDSSMGSEQEIPDPTELLTDIQAVRDWADAIKDKRKTTT